MRYRAGVAGVALGGGRAVIIGDPKTTRREASLRAHGRFIESLGGRYITAEDVGTSVNDMALIHLETRHVTGLPGASGDPSVATAFGTYRGIKAAVEFQLGRTSLNGCRIAVQGLGHVGFNLCRHLAEEKATLLVADIDEPRVRRAVEEFGATPVPPEGIYDVEADVFAPCALGATINDDTIPRLKARVVAGAANNVLAEPRHGKILHDKGILYAPDYVINAGGLISVYGELKGWNGEQSMRKAGEIYDTLLQLFELSREEDLPTYLAADRIAERRIQEIRNLKRIWT